MLVKELFKSLILIFLVAAMLVQTAQLMLSSQLNVENADTSTVLRRYFTDLGVGWLGELIPAAPKTVNYAFSPERFLMPYAISARSNGTASAALANKDALLSYCKDLLPFLTALLKTTPNPSNENFNTVLQRDGILLDFGRPLASTVLCSVLGNSEHHDTMFFQKCFFTYYNNAIRLYFENTNTGQTYYYSSADAIDVKEYQALLSSAADRADFVPVKFTSKTPVDGLSLPSGLLYTEGPLAQAITYRNPLYSEYDKDFYTQALTALFTGLGVSYSAEDRKNEDGSREFVEKHSSITVFPSGQLHYTAAQPSSGIEIGQFLGTDVESASLLSDALIASQLFIDSLSPELLGGGAATLRFNRATWNSADSTCVIEYSYCVDGMPVSVAGQSFGAQLIYDRGYFTDVILSCREYTKSSTAFSTLPTLSTAAKFATLSGVQDVVNLEIGYQDIGKTIIYPNYIIYSRVR